MTLAEFKNAWNTNPSSETEITVTEKDLFTIICGYGFVVQADGNVVFKRLKKTKFTLKEALRMFRIFCRAHGVTHIRVEGSLRRYNFLHKMFKYCCFVKDNSVENRNIYFVKL